MFEQKQERDKHEGKQIIDRLTRQNVDYALQVERFLNELAHANQVNQTTHDE